MQKYIIAMFTIYIISNSLAYADNDLNSEQPANTFVGGWLNKTAESLDLFLVDKSVSDKKNTTKAILETTFRSSEGHAVTTDLGINVNLRLPNFEEYWQLKFTSYDQMKEKRKLENFYLRNNPREENYGATLGFFKKLGNIKTAFQPRIEFQNPLKISHSLSFESTEDYSHYSLNPKVELYASGSKGTGVYWALNFNFSISKVFSFSLINDGDYISQTHVESVTNGISFKENLSDTMYLMYNLLFFSNNITVYHLDGYNLSTIFSQHIFKNILDYQIIPHLDFRSDDSFIGRAGLTLNINFNF